MNFLHFWACLFGCHCCPTGLGWVEERGGGGFVVECGQRRKWAEERGQATGVDGRAQRTVAGRSVPNICLGTALSPASGSPPALPRCLCQLPFRASYTGG